MTNVDPVAYDESSLARNSAAFACSSGVPKRPNTDILSRRFGSEAAEPAGFAFAKRRAMGVAVAPGQIAFTRMLKGPYSCAATRVSASTPAFEAAYSAELHATNAAIEAVFTIAPPPASIMYGIACFIPSQTPRWLTATIRSKDSSVMLTRAGFGKLGDSPALLKI